MHDQLTLWCFQLSFSCAAGFDVSAISYRMQVWAGCLADVVIAIGPTIKVDVDLTII